MRIDQLNSVKSSWWMTLYKMEEFLVALEDLNEAIIKAKHGTE